ncbi:MAG: hypothetical protein KDI79_09280 [Anaerolineae bacterium]|nr:hypothetical protein [Anaerolineae bacterium]
MNFKELIGVSLSSASLTLCGSANGPLTPHRREFSAPPFGGLEGPPGGPFIFLNFISVLRSFSAMASASRPFRPKRPTAPIQ